MSQDIIKQLKKLREIEPDGDFLNRSRSFIVSYEKPGTSVRLRSYFAAWAASFAVIFLIVLGYVFLPTKNNSLPIASAETLTNELQGMNVNLTLEEMSYNNEVNQTINSAISEITNNKAPHLNGGILQSESSKVDSASSVGSSQDSKINELLDQITQ